MGAKADLDPVLRAFTEDFIVTDYPKGWVPPINSQRESRPYTPPASSDAKVQVVKVEAPSKQQL